MILFIYVSGGIKLNVFQLFFLKGNGKKQGLKFPGEIL